ncbi:hypothetical protein B5X24_HaOG211365 [Helicoverpa armigera]|nr:hypothetical protein B5X24_HaOG211365 [Helicoverpa armigera]
MWKMSSQLETIVAAYKTLTKIPSLTGGKLNNAANKVTAKWSVRNLDKGKNTSYATSYTLDSELYVTDESDFGTDISNEILSAISPRENYKAIIREEKNGKDAKKQYLEVWNTNTLSQSVDLTALDIHGDVYADSEFGSLDWSPDEKALVYVAEKKLPKFEPYIKRKAEEKPKLDGSGETAPRKGEEFLYRQDWGEQLVRFSPDGNSVVGVVWETEPRRLGLIFCTNRPSYIFECTLDGAFRKLSGDGLAVRSPRLSPAGDLVWLQREAGGPHHACHQLVIMKKNTNTITTLIDIIDTEVKTVNGYSFTGLYCQSLPHKCFSADGKRLVLSTQHHAEIRAYVLHIESGSITDISNNRGSPYSTSVVDVRFALARINYRGSIGQGEANVRSLLGHIGDYDVKDCLLTLTTLLERDERLCPKNIFLNGGSYGGLIVAHLAGLYPDRFNAVVMRNPLIDLASKANYADNYDGCAAESGFDFTEKGPVSEEQLLAMRRCSPIAHVHKVKAPTALMLGSGDKRVPHFQGLEYARRLKANGVPTRIYMYDDNHSLSSPAAEMDNLINGAHWFMEHLQL